MKHSGWLLVAAWWGVAACAGEPPGGVAVDARAQAEVDAGPACAAADDVPVPTRCTPAAWRVERVLAEPRLNSGISIAVAADGTPTIGTGIGNRAVVIDRRGDAWIPQDVDTVTVAATFVRVADGGGALHAVYSCGADLQAPDTCYGVRRAGAWSMAELGPGFPRALAADRCGVHALLFAPRDDRDGDQQPWQAVDAHQAPGLLWTRTTIDPARAGFGSIALDPGGQPHALYVSGSQLRHATPSDHWRHRNVAGTARSAVAPLAIDRHGQLHTVFILDDALGRTSDLRYGVQRPDRSWQFEDIETSAEVWHATMAVDVDGRPHVVYLGNGARAVYTWRSPDGQWHPAALPLPATTLDVDLAIDAAGALHLASRDDDGLAYASTCPEVP